MAVAARLIALPLFRARGRLVPCLSWDGCLHEALIKIFLGHVCVEPPSFSAPKVEGKLQNNTTWVRCFVACDIVFGV